MSDDHANHHGRAQRTSHGSHTGHCPAGPSLHHPPTSVIATPNNRIEHIEDPFSQEVAGLPPARAGETVELKDGDLYELVAAPVRRSIGQHQVRMLAYNGSTPGPTLKVRQGDSVRVRFTNGMDGPTTVHWHGLRVENRFDGMPGHGGPPPVTEGESFEYELRFPDAGIYWYHPHVREDYAQEHGLYGSILVVPQTPSFWPAADHEIILVVDDILIEQGQIAPVSRSGPRRTAMGRFGNTMLLNGEVEPEISLELGAVTRLYFVNTANTRTFNLIIPGARMKLVGGDSGPYERETFVDSVLISPAERYVVDVLFEEVGRFALEHRTPDRSYRLATLSVNGASRSTQAADGFGDLRHNHWLTEELAPHRHHFDRPPDKTLALIGTMPGMDHHAGHHIEPIEWEDSMPDMNVRSSMHNMYWKLVDEETGLANDEIDWSFRMGDQVMLRVRNDRPSDHPMQHPFHVHGQRFLIVGRNGAANENLAWKDTVLVRAGDVIDILVDMHNPGTWMAHCHIAEHMESNMMLMFRVGEGQPEHHVHA